MHAPRRAVPRQREQALRLEAAAVTWRSQPAFSRQPPLLTRQSRSAPAVRCGKVLSTRLGWWMRSSECMRAFAPCPPQLLGPMPAVVARHRSVEVCFALQHPLLVSLSGATAERAAGALEYERRGTTRKRQRSAGTGSHHSFFGEHDFTGGCRARGSARAVQFCGVMRRIDGRKDELRNFVSVRPLATPPAKVCLRQPPPATSSPGTANSSLALLAPEQATVGPERAK